MKFPTRQSHGSCVSTRCAAGISASLTGAEKSSDHRARLAESLAGQRYKTASFYTVRFTNGESFTVRGQTKVARLVTALTGIPCNHGMPSHWTRGSTAIHPRWGILSVSREEVS